MQTHAQENGAPGPNRKAPRDKYSGFNYTSQADHFKQAIRDYGLNPPDHIEPGRVYKFPGRDKGRGNDAARCKLFDDMRGGWFADWSNGGEQHFWWASGAGEMSDAEREEYRREAEESRKRREVAEAQRRAEAASKARALADEACKTPTDNPYLVSKGVEPVPALLELPIERVEEVLGYRPQSKGAPLSGRILVAPVTIGGKLSTCELIDEQGRKSAIAGGQKKGGFWTPEPAPNDAEVIAIGEGIATVLSVRQATGWPVVAALSSGNLEAVARQMRERHPNAKLAILADIKKDTGEIDHGAVAACDAAGGILAVPDFGPHREMGATDWNDLHKARGIRAVQRQLETLTGKKPDAALALIAEPFTEEELAEASLTPTCIVRDYLYADVAVLAAAGGTGKTTCLIYESICIALGCPAWGLEVVTPGATIFFTAEDQRSIFAARLREIMGDMGLSPAARRLVLDRVRVLDLTGADTRLVFSDNGIIRVGGFADTIVTAYRNAPPVQIVFDPLVSFGASEEKINDNAQALITAARRIVRGLGCCVRYVHHVGQDAARNKTLDAYAGRGGSALADGARMVAAMVSWSENDAGTRRPPFGFHAGAGESVAIMARPKLSYSKPDLPLIWIKRKGWAFEHHAEVKVPKEQRKNAAADQVEAYLTEQTKSGRYHTMKSLEEAGDELSLSRAELRKAVNELQLAQRVVHANLPKELCQGAKKTFLCPANLAAYFGEIDGQDAQKTDGIAPTSISRRPIRKEKTARYTPPSSSSPPSVSPQDNGEIRRDWRDSENDANSQPVDLNPDPDIEWF